MRGSSRSPHRRLTAGWLLPLAATVPLEIADEGCTVTAGWELDAELVSPHASFQAAGNPYEPRPLWRWPVTACTRCRGARRWPRYRRNARGARA